MSKWLGCFFLDFSSFCLPSSLVCVVLLSTIWTFASGIKTHALPGLSVSFLWIWYQNHSSICQSHFVITMNSIENRNICSTEVLLSKWKYIFWLLFIFKLISHKPLTTTLQLTHLMDYKMFVWIQKLAFSIYENINNMHENIHDIQR